MIKDDPICRKNIPLGRESLEEKALVDGISPCIMATLKAFIYLA
jgi:hypothetical protein